MVYELKSLIREGEHQTQDFKFRVDDPKKIARTLAAFANTDGGRLLIGVKDNGKVVGVNPEEEHHIIEGAADLFCTPKVPFTSRVWQDDHKLVLEIIVSPSALKPHQAKDENDKWKVYVRRKDHTLLANKILLDCWKLEKKKSIPPQKFSETEQLILTTIKEYESLTISKLYRVTKLKKRVIDRLLVLFVNWGIVNMSITPEGTFYSLKEVNRIHVE